MPLSPLRPPAAGCPAVLPHVAAARRPQVRGPRLGRVLELLLGVLFAIAATSLLVQPL